MGGGGESIFQLKTNADYDGLLLDLGAPLDDAWKSSGFNDWNEVSFAVAGVPLRERWHRMPVEESRGDRRKYRGRPVDFRHVDMGSMLAISARALAIITPLLGAVIEALPLDNVTRPERRYFMLNTLDLVDCLDEERSTLTRYSSGKIMDIKEYVFRPGTTAGHHLFRLAQRPKGPILASSEFKQLVEESGLVGLEFHPVGL